MAHARELIVIHDNYNLGEFSEISFVNNKIFRSVRQYLARKDSQETNLSNCFDRLWLNSDLVVCHTGPKICLFYVTKNNTYHII